MEPLTAIANNLSMLALNGLLDVPDTQQRPKENRQDKSIKYKVYHELNFVLDILDFIKI